MEIPRQALRKLSEDLDLYYRVLNSFRYVFLITALGSNSVVCFVMIKTKGHQQTLSKFFIFHLAIADILFRILEMYELITERATRGRLFPIHCKIVVFCQYVFAAVLFCLLAGIAVDRSKIIIYPLQSLKRRNNHRGKRAITFIWLYALSISTTFLYSATEITLTRKFDVPRENISQAISANNTDRSKETLSLASSKTHCVAGPRASSRSQISFTIYFICGFVIPLLTMAICYIRVISFLRYRTKNRMLNQSVFRSKRKTVLILLLLVLGFLVSWGPILVLELLQPFLVLVKDTELWIRPLAKVLSLSSSLFNPFIYAFGNPWFRKQVISLLSCKRNHGCFSRLFYFNT